MAVVGLRRGAVVMGLYVVGHLLLVHVRMYAWFYANLATLILQLCHCVCRDPQVPANTWLILTVQHTNMQQDTFIRGANDYGQKRGKILTKKEERFSDSEN